MGRAVSPLEVGEVALRPATVADVGDVAWLLAALGYPCEPADAAVRIAAVAEDPRQQLLIAQCGERACGLLGLDLMYYVPLGAVTCRITVLVIEPGAQRLGLGRRLLREAERRARAAGAAQIELTTAAHRADAHAFYRACGYIDNSLRFSKALGAA